MLLWCIVKDELFYLYSYIRQTFHSNTSFLHNGVHWINGMAYYYPFYIIGPLRPSKNFKNVQKEAVILLS